MSEKFKSNLAVATDVVEEESNSCSEAERDVFGNEEGHQIHYKTMSWQFVSLLMIAEIVSNGMLSLPNALAVVGIFPGVFLIIFLGVFGLFTAKLLVDFKLNHPDVHSMGDAGMLLFGPIGREILGGGTVIFAICATGSELFSGQQVLSALTNNGLCSIFLVVIFAAVAFLVSLPRALNNLTWLGLGSCVSILTAGLVTMVGAGVNPAPERTLQAVIPQSFYQALLAVTNPVFAYAGHFMFFALISEMKRPQDAMKAAWVLQGFATVFYAVFAVVCYVYMGPTVNSIAILSLPPIWEKIALGIAFPNFLIGGGLYIHVAAKLVFIRLLRHSKHVHSHTIRGWSIWVFLCFSATALALIFTIAVPIFSLLIGLSAALFASWYTYGIAGFFHLYDTYQMEGGKAGLKRQPWRVLASLLTILAGAFICIAGTYVFIKLIVDAYASGTISKPFTC